MTDDRRSRLFETPSVPTNYRRYLLPTVFGHVTHRFTMLSRTNLTGRPERFG
jgi:hypothetical protein